MQIEDLKQGQYYINVNFGVCIFSRIEEFNKKTYAIFQFANYKELDVLKEKVNKEIRIYDINVGNKDKDKKIKLDTFKENNSWQKKKAKALEQIRQNAMGLMQLQAKRNLTKGFQFSKDTELQRQFENLCPYELTTGQQQSLNEIKKDMESNKPMNRLLMADVGMGKTEIAIRTVFKAVQDNKQCIVLAPTSVLAKQHYNDFSERYKNFGINVVFLCGDTKKSEKERILKSIENGTVQVIIGTHAVLSNKVKYNNVGLMITDEEQKFGSLIKEKIKKIQINIDILSMSATPIPRTTEQSLVGIANVSKIKTAPKNKKPINTRIINNNNLEIIKEAIQKELNRNGQIYFVDNNIDNLPILKNKLLDLIPNLKIGIVYGKMKNEEKNIIMNDFKNKKYDLLLATTVIETGVNVKNANTIFINQANYLGLAQLHQIRGRVSRGQREGYCYLIQSENITDSGVERLNTIKNNNQLGAGEKIAEKDLSMRGMGELTGIKQHGLQYAIGYEYYMELLKKEINKLKNNSNNFVF